MLCGPSYLVQMVSIMMTKSLSRVAVAWLVPVAAGLTQFAFSPAAAGASVHDRWKLGGPGGWDLLAVDSSTRRLFITRSDRVDVIDADSGKPVGQIAHTDGVHGVALAADLGRGYTSNGRANTITVFDAKTLKPLQEIKVDGQNPDAIIYDSATKRVLSFNGRSSNASAFDGRTGKAVGTVALGGKPEWAASDGRGRVFVNIEDKAELVVIDSRTLRVTAHWPLTGCEEPTGLALDARHNRVFSVCQNQKMVVTDGSDGRQVASVAIGHGPDGAAFDAGRDLVYSSNGDGTLTVVHEDDPEHFSVVENIATQKSARTLALDAKTQRIFLAAADFGAPPEPTAEQPHPRPPMVADSFAILVVGD